MHLNLTSTDDFRGSFHEVEYIKLARVTFRRRRIHEFTDDISAAYVGQSTEISFRTNASFHFVQDFFTFIFSIDNVQIVRYLRTDPMR